MNDSAKAVEKLLHNCIWYDIKKVNLNIEIKKEQTCHNMLVSCYSLSISEQGAVRHFKFTRLFLIRP